MKGRIPAWGIACALMIGSALWLRGEVNGIKVFDETGRQ